jgi:hypothetical protein
MKSELATIEGFVREVKEAELTLVGVTPIFERKEITNIGLLTRAYLALTGCNNAGYFAGHSVAIGEAYSDSKEMKSLLEELEAERTKIINRIKEIDTSAKVRLIDGRVFP